MALGNRERAALNSAQLQLLQASQVGLLAAALSSCKHNNADKLEFHSDVPSWFAMP